MHKTKTTPAKTTPAKLERALRGEARRSEVKYLRRLDAKKRSREAAELAEAVAKDAAETAKQRAEWQAEAKAIKARLSLLAKLLREKPQARRTTLIKARQAADQLHRKTALSKRERGATGGSSRAFAGLPRAQLRWVQKAVAHAADRTKPAPDEIMPVEFGVSAIEEYSIDHADSFPQLSTWIEIAISNIRNDAKQWEALPERARVRMANVLQRTRSRQTVLLHQRERA